MKRREFITLLGGAAAWPLAAQAQQAERMRRIGVLSGVADDQEGQARVAALKQGLQELGWTDGRNIQIETRFGGGDVGPIRAHAAELVALAPDVIAGQTTPAIRALRQATSSIPIVMAAANDPVEQGFVSSLAHPGGNITGFTFIDFQMVGKCLEVLKEAAPGGGDIVMDFAGYGVGSGDWLLFVGYGPGATFTNIDTTHWQVNYNNGTAHDVITFMNGASIDPTDVAFI